MANILGKDEATYAKERDVFVRDLQHFHEIRGTPFKRAPTIGGKQVDLYLLYTLVTAQGGWLRVNSKNSWSDILPILKLPASCVNGCIAIKQVYLRYLDRWEKVHFLHEDADRASDDDEESRHKRWSARSLHSVPCSYNYGQHNVTDANREHNHLSTNLYKQSDYERLCLSLISPLPNEQDFAINVCTLLSNDGKHTLKLEKHPRLVDHLLAHAGVFNHGSTRLLFLHFYNIIRKKPLHNFWNEVLESTDHLELTNESIFKSTTTEPTPLPPTIVDADSLTDSDCQIVDQHQNLLFKPNPEDEELFCLKRNLGMQDYVGQRVLQIATILRNLSFIEENVPVLVKNSTFLRFLLLCCVSKWNVLKNLGMDMLSNVASEYVMAHQDLLAGKLLRIVTEGLNSQDRAGCISSLDVLNKLSQNEANEETLQKSLQKTVYGRVCSFLTLHDVMLLIYTLECLYSLSSLGEKSCNCIFGNHGVIDTLVALITVEGKSYGPKACIGMKLVETLPSGGSQQAQVQNATQSSQTSQSQTSTTSTTTTSSTTPSSTSSSTFTTINSSSACTTSTTLTPVVNNNSSSSSPTPSKSAPPTTPVRQVPIVPQRLIPINPSPSTAATSSTSSVIQSTSTIMTPQQLIQQQHAHQQVIHENEQFALAWLRATYEPCANGKVDHQELYKQYLNSCSSIGRKGVISPLHFPRCVRSIFGGTVGPNPMKQSNSNDPQYYDGIKVRDKPLIINIPPSALSNTITTTTTAAASSSSTCTTPLTSQNNNAKQPAAVNPPKVQQVRRKSSVQPILVTTTDVNIIDDGVSTPAVAAAATAASPASPILKAQLSAPPKQRDATSSSPVTNKGDVKSQAIAHPHLSQALLGLATTTNTSTSNNTTTTTTMVVGGVATTTTPTAPTQTTSGQTSSSSNTSLIKSLLATKVAARQQRLLAQQADNSKTAASGSNTMKEPATKPSPRLNGVRQLFPDSEIGDPSVSSTTQFTDLTKGKKEPPQPPPPPLAPLSNNLKTSTGGGKSQQQQRIDEEDSDSAASSSGLGTIGLGGVSSTEDNSMTSFEGLLNGIPNADNISTGEDGNSKDQMGSSEISMHKPLRLADLLEKKFEKSPPLLNGGSRKELRLGDKAMDLVENHIEKALSRDTDDGRLKMEVDGKEDGHREMLGIKRSASEEMMEIEAKRPLLSTNLNGSSTAASPAPDSSSSNGDDGPSRVSTAAAKLFADIAADILEDEDEEQLLQEAQMHNASDHHHQQQHQQQQPPPAPQQIQLQPAPNPLQQIIVDNNGQQMFHHRQIIVSQAQLSGTNQMVFSTGAHLKTQSGQTVIVQNASGQRPVMLTQPNAGGPILLSQNLQGQMQIVASSQTGQYVLQTGNSGGAYVVTQPQTAMVHGGGQQQTVLLAQTAQQQGTGAKTIIILQQQPQTTVASAAVTTATQHQKVVVTPQGQQVVVTQVPRPVAQTSSVSNNVGGKSTGVAGGQPPPAVNSSAMNDKKEDIKKQKIARDLTTPYVCEWSDCVVEKKFKSANEVYLHACELHCPTGGEEVLCQWDRCDNMKRSRFSLMTHLHDKHCNTEAMKQSLTKRKQAAHTTPSSSSSSSSKTEMPAPSTPSPHPGYAPDAALHAIKRHAMEFVNPKELQDDNEGPVTKSIRLTASLILRNLVIYSSQCKRYLKSYESHLANVALSNVESSRTIAQILFDMNDGSTHR